MYVKKRFLCGLMVVLMSLVLLGCSSSKDQYQMNLTVEGEGDVVASPDQEVYPADSTVELEAQQTKQDWFFDHWDGTISGSENPMTVVMDRDQTITAVFVANESPVLKQIGNQSVNPGENLKFTVTASDADPEDTVTLSVTNLPAGASFTPATGVFSWTPTQEQRGSHGVTFRASDGKVEVSETIGIAVGEENQAPVLDPIGKQEVNECETLTFTVTASDPDGGEPVLSVEGLPSGATFDAETGVFTWTPTALQANLYGLTFTASDGTLEDSEKLNILVLHVNQAPVLDAIGDQVVNEGESLSFTVTASDIDTHDTITLSVTGKPEGANFDPTTGEFSWNPTHDQGGDYSLVFTASDGELADSETVLVTVRDVAVEKKLVIDTTYKPSDPWGSMSYDIYIMNMDASDPVNLTNTSWDENDPDVSQDGSKIAYVSKRYGEREIYVMNADGSNQVNISNSPDSEDHSPTWSPDGTKIAFVSDRDNGYPQIYVMNADGSNQVNITNNAPEYSYDPDWSPDGSKILFNLGVTLAVMNVDGSNQVAITDNTYSPSDASWSPDGTKITFSGSPQVGDHWDDIFVMNADGTNLVNLTKDLSTLMNYNPVWAPDGTKIAFTEKYEISIMNPDGTDRVCVTSWDMGINNSASWMPGQ